MSKILLGTYTKRNSEGIYSIDFEEHSLSLDNLQLIAKTENPTYVDYDSFTKRLFAVAQKGDMAGLAVYDYDGESAKEVFTRLEKTTPPCYVAFHPQENLIYEANYHKGKAIVTTHDGVLDKVFEYGEGAKAHFMDFDPKTDAVFVCDLGSDVIHKYSLLNEIATYYTPKGTGPRHIAFHPSKPILYVFGELSSTITVLRDEGFSLEHVQTISTLPSPQELNWGAAIKISKDGKYVYASNRADNTISVLEVMDDASLKLVQHISTYGEHPRDFDLSYDDKYLLCANMQSDTLTLFERNPDNGILEMRKSGIYAPEVVCVKFI